MRPGEVLANRYRIESSLGHGGMGDVFKVNDTLLNSTIALKILNPEIARTQDSIERLKHEVILARRFTHPNACRIYDFGEADGTFYISMEYIPGQTLASLLRAKMRLSIEEGLPILQQVLEALSAAHSAGVIHRDLKPQNIMVSGNKAYVMDFGISIGSELTRLTQTGMIIGTPQYMAPEQFVEGTADNRSDLYSFGVILFEVFTGKLPFDAKTAAALMYAHANTPPPAPRTFVAELPQEVEIVILRSLEKDPNSRYQNAEEIIHAFKEIRYPKTKVINPVNAEERKAIPPPVVPEKSGYRQRFSFKFGLFLVAIFLLSLLVTRTYLEMKFADTTTKKPQMTMPNQSQKDISEPPSAPSAAATEFFPLKKGNYWIYKGDVTSYLNKAKEPWKKDLIWKMEIIDTMQRADFSVAVLEGHLSSATMHWWAGGSTESQKEVEERTRYLIATPDSQKFYLCAYQHLDSESERIRKREDAVNHCASDSTLFLDLPLHSGKRFGEPDQLARPHGLFWKVESPEAVDASFDGQSVYRVTKHGNPRFSPDHYEIVDYAAGIGIVRFQYGNQYDNHPDSAVQSFDLRLVEYNVQ